MGKSLPNETANSPSSMSIYQACFPAACRVTRRISPGRHRSIRGSHVPVPRQTITVMPFTSYRLTSRGYVLHQISKGPDLPSMGVTREHQTYTSTRCLFSLPRCMGEEDCRARGATRQCPGNGIAALTRAVVGSKVVNTGKYKGRPDFCPRVVKHP